MTLSRLDPLIVDLYAGDLEGRPDWRKLVRVGPPWHGAIIKATEGLHYAPEWFAIQWRLLRELGGDRYGVDWFRGCYHYLRFADNPEEQAERYLDFVDEAGGWGPGDILPIVDVERASNAGVARERVVDATSTWIEVVKRETGRDVILYGGSLLAELRIADRLGAAALWIARYTPTLPHSVITRIGWTVDDLFAWQYAGDGTAFLDGYPHTSPLGKTDISAVTVAGGGEGALQWLRARASNVG